MNISDIGNPILSHTRARMMRDSRYAHVYVVIIDDFSDYCKISWTIFQNGRKVLAQV